MSRDALVIGVNAYQYLPSLQAPARDAEAIAQQLQTFGEFRVHRVPEVIQAGKPQVGQKTPVTLREVETALINLFKPRGSTVPHTAIFYFSGHGIQREAGIREGYLALSDSNPDQGFYGLSLFWLRRLLQESPVRQRIILLDCCHSGELLNFLEADPGAHPGTDRLFMAASREYETAYESIDSPYSVFTQALLTGLDPRRIEAGVVTNHSLTDWVNDQLKGEIQQPLFESSGSEIILTRCYHAATTFPVAKTTAICPYRGLESFGEAHADFFFGREELTTQLIDRLQTESFIALIGASGIGKSSLVRAGLIPQLKQQGNPWRIKLLTPGEHPLKSLATAFIDPDLTELERAEQLRRAETFLAEGSRGFAQLIQASLPIVPEQSAVRPKLLLVIDQFEELFTLTQGLQAEQERQQFLNCLVNTMALVPDRLRVVVILRADFLEKCTHYRGLAEQIEQHRLVVTPLKYEQIKATIVRPAQKVGLICEPNLVYTMLLDVIGAPGELPLLQYTLLELWHHRRLGNEGSVARLTLDAYQELGGVRGTLQKRATEVFHSLTAEDQVVAKRIFLALTQLGEGTEDTRRRVLKSELVSPACPIDRVERVLETLVAAKLVVTNQERIGTRHPVQDCSVQYKAASRQFVQVGGGNQKTAPELRKRWGIAASTPIAPCQETVDVAHETLIRHWSLLRGWLDENRDMLRRLRRIEQAAHEWSSAGQPPTGDYLLHGLRLRDAEDFTRLHAQELSAVAQQFVAVSHEVSRRARRESRRLQIAVPSVLLGLLTIVFSQYHGAVKTQAEQDQQLQLATSRERAAIAQAILKDPDSDPMAAVLISRLAASEDPSFDTQASLRAALQNLRLQLEFPKQQGAIHQLAFSPNHCYLAAAGADGTVRLWGLGVQTIYSTSPQPLRVLAWSTTSTANVTAIAFSPDGEQVAAIAQNSAQVKVWSIASGEVALRINAAAPITQLAFSPDGQWIATADAEQTITVWRAATGDVAARLPQPNTIQALQFSPNGKFLVFAEQPNRVQLWRLVINPETQDLQLRQSAALSHSAPLNQIAFSTSGRWIATASPDAIRLWDATTGKLHQTLSTLPNQPRTIVPHAVPAAARSPLTQVLFSPDEQTIAAMDAQHHLWLWDIQSGQIRASWATVNDTLENPSAAVQSVGQAAPDLLRFSPDSRAIGTATPHPAADGHYAVHLWNTQTGQAIGSLSGHRGAIETIEFSPDGTYIATAGADGVARLWTATPGGELPTLKLPDAPVQWAMFLHTPSPQTTYSPSAYSPSEIVTTDTTSDAAYIKKWQNSTLFRLVSPVSSPLTLTADRQATMSSTASREATLPNGGVALATIAPSGKLQRWQILTSSASADYSTAVQSGDQIKPQTLWSRMMMLLHPSPAEQAIQVRQVSEATRSPLLTLPLATSIADPNASLQGAALSPDNTLVATANADGLVDIYQMQADQSMRLIQQIQNWQTSPGKDTVLSQPLTATALSSPVAAPPSTAKHSSDPVLIHQLVFSPDGRQLLGIADDLTVRLWDVHSGQLLHVLQKHRATVQQAQFSPDGQWIVTASWDHTAQIWQAASGQVVKVLSHPDAVSSASFSPDGQQLVTTSWDGTTRVWDVKTATPQMTLHGHQAAVLDAQFSPDGRSLVTASADGSAILWTVQTGTEQAQLRPIDTGNPPESIVHAGFSPDGQYVTTLTKSGQVQLWAATWETLLNLARDRSLRQLTPVECNRYLKLSPQDCPMLPTKS